jgi:putative MATE family efflux protein
MDFMKKVLANSLIACLGVAVLISGISVVFTSTFVSMVHVPERVHEQAELFFRISSAGLIAQFGMNWFSGMLRGLGDAKTPLRILFVATFLTIASVYICIAVFHMGVVGAAVGQIVATLIASIWGYFDTVKRNSLFDMRNWDFSIDWPVIGKIVGIGIPVSMQMMVASLSGTLIVSMVNRFGPEMTAGYGIGMQIDQIAFLPAMSIGMAISSMVGQNLGVKRYDRVKKILYVSLLLSVGLSALMFVLVKVAPISVAGLFTTDNAVAVNAAAYWHIVAWSYMTYAIMFALQGVVRGAGDTMVLLVFSAIALIGVRFPLAGYLSTHFGLGADGIWWAVVISTLVGVALSLGYYLSGRWMRRVVIPAEIEET